MEVAKATRTALMAGTLLAQREPLNGFGGDHQTHATARPGRSMTRAALRQLCVIPPQSRFREGQALR
jgi:hypothetical protein